ncbi:MAG: hypothetical protein ACI4P4_00625 [Faecousia sp.]
MAVPSEKSVTRRHFVGISAAIIGIAVSSIPAMSFAKENAVTSTEYDYQTDQYHLMRHGNLLEIEIFATGESASGIVADDGQSIRISENGVETLYVLSNDGNVYRDKRIAIEVQKMTVPRTRAVPSGYKYLTRWRSNTKTSGTIASITLALIGLFPGMGGVATVAGIIANLATAGQDTVYIEITQYYNPYTYYIYQITRLYRNPDYTGLIQTIEEGPFKPV